MLRTVYQFTLRKEDDGGADLLIRNITEVIHFKRCISNLACQARVLQDPDKISNPATMQHTKKIPDESAKLTVLRMESDGQNLRKIRAKFLEVLTKSRAVTLP